jgi:membrane-associated protease RseP (regulator of RpoE activity)
VVMLGGPFMNFFLGMLLVTIALSGIGAQQLSLTINSVIACVEPSGPQGECAPGDPVSPAQAAGFQAGDRVISVNGEPISEWAQVIDAFAARPGEAGRVTVARGASQAVLTVTPIFIERQLLENGRPAFDSNGFPLTELRPFFGVQLRPELRQLSVGESLAAGIESTLGVVGLVIALPQAFADVRSLPLGSPSATPTGPFR